MLIRNIYLSVFFITTLYSITAGNQDRFELSEFTKTAPSSILDEPIIDDILDESPFLALLRIKPSQSYVINLEEEREEVGEEVKEEIGEVKEIKEKEVKMQSIYSNINNLISKNNLLLLFMCKNNLLELMISMNNNINSWTSNLKSHYVKNLTLIVLTLDIIDKTANIPDLKTMQRLINNHVINRLSATRRHKNKDDLILNYLSNKNQKVALINLISQIHIQLKDKIAIYNGYTSNNECKNNLMQLLKTYINQLEITIFSHNLQKRKDFLINILAKITWLIGVINDQKLSLFCRMVDTGQKIITETNDILSLGFHMIHIKSALLEYLKQI